MVQTVSSLTYFETGAKMAKKTRFVLGTAAFGMDYGVTNACGKVPADKIRAILATCLKNGIGELDTAQVYGRAEEELGQAGVEEFTITTKIYIRPEESAKTVAAKFSQSLRLLKVNQVKNLLLHNEDCLNRDDGDQIAEEFHRLVAKGFVSKVGVSSYDPIQALAFCQKYGFQIAQVPANALDNRLFQGGLIERFIEKKIEVQIRSIFLQGVLLENPKNQNVLPKEVVRLAEQFRNQCREQGYTPLQGALGHIMQASQKTKIIFGATETKELEQFLTNLPSQPSKIHLSSPGWNPKFDPRNWKF